MKKLLILSLMAGTLIFAVPNAEAKTVAKTEASLTSTPKAEQPRRRWRNNRRWNNRRSRTVVRSRIVWRWGRRYRETYRITYYPNGRTRTQIIRRVRIW